MCSEKPLNSIWYWRNKSYHEPNVPFPPLSWIVDDIFCKATEIDRIKEFHIVNGTFGVQDPTDILGV